MSDDILQAGASLSSSSSSSSSNETRTNEQRPLTLENIQATNLLLVPSFAQYRGDNDDLDSLRSGNTANSNTDSTSGPLQNSQINESYQDETNSDALLSELVSVTVPGVTAQNSTTPTTINNNNNSARTHSTTPLSSSSSAHFPNLHIDSLLVEETTSRSSSADANSFSRLSRTVRSFLNATSSTTSIDQSPVETNRLG